MSKIDISKIRFCDACDRTTINNKTHCNTYELNLMNLHKPVKLCEDCLAELYVVVKMQLVADGLQDKAQDLYLKKIDEVMGD